MNWKELKDFANSLPESELEKNVILWREYAEDAITNIACEQLDEDQYIHIDTPEEGCFPKSQAESFIDYSPEDYYPNPWQHFKKVYDKGNAILHEVF